MKEKSYGISPYYIKDREIFILLNKTSHISDWNFFKGKIEKDETIKECALREFAEEARHDFSEHPLEDFFLQKNKRKDVGIFLIQIEKRLEFYYDRKEIFQYDWIKLESDIKLSKNQQKIYNDIFLFLKPLKDYLKNTSITNNTTKNIKKEII